MARTGRLVRPTPQPRLLCSTAVARLPPLLPASFYARDALEVARDLLGKELRRGRVRLRIVEVEAYRAGGDTANHGRAGRTARNAPMWGPAGHAYVYLCYGLHHMLNLVTDGPDVASAVLIRACEPLEGTSLVQRRRGLASDGPELLAGPGRVGQALGLDLSWNDHPLYRAGGLEVRDGPPPRRIATGPRVGIDYAAPEHREAPWRLADADSRWVSRRSGLRPPPPWARRVASRPRRP